MMMKQTLGSLEQNAGYRFDMGSYRDPTRYAAQKDDVTLQDFFCRPIKIQEFSWGVGGSVFESFNPWQTFFENPRVINRISNYNLLRADLHVRFMITGNGFHYGRLLASYNALPLADKLGTSRALFPNDAVQESQKPHVYLDPTTSQGGDLKCPFFWYKDALSIPDQDWRQMGEVNLRSLNALKHANGASDVVTISVLAWAEDVELSIPTSAEPGSISPQADCPFDEVVPQAGEYSQSPVSTPASVVARIAGKLVDVPGIGLYARATELAASAVASVARLFGFSRPALIQDINTYVPRYMGHLAPTNMGDAVQKLTVDAKQELTIDPRVTGLTEMDELQISSIAERESYLTTFPWTVADTPETTVFSIRVSPVQYNYAAPEFSLTPSALAVLPFKYWRCKMRYRFQIVSSNYHKGRLRLVWDPYGFTSNEFNVNYTQIVDISEEKDFTIEIGWGFENHFALTGAVFPTLPFATGTLGEAGNLDSNGLLRVLVFNELTVPNTSINNDIEINVFTSAVDLEVGAPDSTEINRLQWFATPAGAQVEDGDEDPVVPQAGIQGDMEDTVEPSAPMQTGQVRTMGTEIDTSDPTFHVFFGETIESFRQLLKRYCYSESVVSDVNTGSHIQSQFTTALPLLPGYAPDGIHVSNTGSPYNYTACTTLNWLMPAYVGWRGAVRWKLLQQGQQRTEATGSMSVIRYPAETGYDLSTVTLPVGSANSQSVVSDLFRITYQDSGQGMATTPTSVQPTLEYELPYYTTNRFSFARGNSYVLFNDVGAQYQRITNVYFGLNNAATFGVINKYCAVGEDFNLFYFNGVPNVFTREVPPPG